MANVILLGDGWWGTNSTTPTSRMDVVSGAGRVRAHWPSSSDLVAPWAWGWHKYTISTGQDVTWTVGSGGPMSSAVTQYKAAFVMMPSSLSSIPDIDFYLEDTCPAGGGIVTIASDTGYDLRSRFRLSASAITGKCLRVRAHGFSGTATFWSADYLHSGTPADH